MSATAASVQQYRIQYILIIGELLQDAVLQTVSLTAEQKAVVILIEIAVVRQTEEFMSHAVGKGDLFIQPFPVQPVVPGLLVMGQDVHGSQGQTGRKPLEFRCRFPNIKSCSDTSLLKPEFRSQESMTKSCAIFKKTKNPL